MKSIQFLGKRVLWLLGCFFLTALALASESVTYYHNDVAGTPVLATDASGAVVWKETYLPYGKKQTNAAASANNRIGFTGKPYDSATGLSYFGARYYDPLVGRFNGIDPQGFDEGNLHSFNRYAYANNNPYKFVDPDGRQAVENFLPEGAPIVANGKWLGAAAAYVVGAITGDTGLRNAGSEGMAENRQANIEGLIIMGSMGRGLTQKVSDLKLLHSPETIGRRPDLGKLSDAELMRSVTNPLNGDKIKISTESGKVVDGNSRALELQRRAADPKSSITPNTKVPVEHYTPDRSMF